MLNFTRRSALAAELHQARRHPRHLRQLVLASESMLMKSARSMPSHSQARAYLLQLQLKQQPLQLLMRRQLRQQLPRSLINTGVFSDDGQSGDPISGAQQAITSSRCLRFPQDFSAEPSDDMNPSPKDSYNFSCVALGRIMHGSNQRRRSQCAQCCLVAQLCKRFILELDHPTDA